MRHSNFTYILLCSFFITCSSSDPYFSQEETITPELKDSIINPIKVEIKPPYLILQNTIGGSILIDSLYVKDALRTNSKQDPDMVDYYTDPDMKRVYVNEDRVIFCYGYKKQIDFMDFNYNLLNKVKFKFDNPALVDPKYQGDIKLSYVCSYLGKSYFYTLFWGKSSDEPVSLSSQNSFLEVFDLEGNPVIRYRLKGKKPPVYFGVDEETFTLYGCLFNNNPEDNMIVYKLKGLL